MNITEINAAANGERPAVKAIQRGRCQCELKDQLIAAVRELRKLGARNSEIYTLVGNEGKPIAWDKARMMLMEAGSNLQIIASLESTIDHLLTELDKLEVE